MTTTRRATDQLPQYEADDGPLTAAQLKQITRTAGQEAFGAIEPV